MGFSRDSNQQRYYIQITISLTMETICYRWRIWKRWRGPLVAILTDPASTIYDDKQLPNFVFRTFILTNLHFVFTITGIRSLTQCQSKLQTSVISFKRLAEATPSWSRSERGILRQSSRSDAPDFCTHWLSLMPRKPTNWRNLCLLACNERTSKHDESVRSLAKCLWFRG